MILHLNKNEYIKYIKDHSKLIVGFNGKTVTVHIENVNNLDKLINLLERSRALIYPMSNNDV